MDKLFDAFLKAIRSVFAPGMFMVFVQSVAVTLAVLIAFIILITMVAGGLFASLDMTGGLWGITATGFIATLVAWFLFPGIMPIIVNFFDVKIIRLIEQEDYPAAPKATEPPFWPEFWHDVRFSLKAILYNVLLLPLYFIPLINIIVFYSLNGYLLGREFFNVAARRHIGVANAEALRKQHARVVTIGGAALVFLATIPFVNLVAPFWGIALMTHLYHTLQNTPRSQVIV